MFCPTRTCARLEHTFPDVTQIDVTLDLHVQRSHRCKLSKSRLICRLKPLEAFAIFELSLSLTAAR